jgi:hypothetical protein
VRSLWQDSGALDKQTLAPLPVERTHLRSMHKDQALCQALTIVSTRRRPAKVLGDEGRRPRFSGMAGFAMAQTLSRDAEASIWWFGVRPCVQDDRRHRTGAVFRCIACDHRGDADFIGARNVLTKTRSVLGRVYCPRGKKCQ